MGFDRNITSEHHGRCPDVSVPLSNLREASRVILGSTLSIKAHPVLCQNPFFQWEDESSALCSYLMTNTLCSIVKTIGLAFSAVLFSQCCSTCLGSISLFFIISLPFPSPFLSLNCPFLPFLPFYIHLSLCYFISERPLLKREDQHA